MLDPTEDLDGAEKEGESLLKLEVLARDQATRPALKGGTYRGRL